MHVSGLLEYSGTNVTGPSFAYSDSGTGTVVMLLRNLNLKAGLCNGTRLLVMELKPHVLMCEILTGVHKDVL